MTGAALVNQADEATQVGSVHGWCCSIGEVGVGLGPGGFINECTWTMTTAAIIILSGHMIIIDRMSDLSMFAYGSK